MNRSGQVVRPAAAQNREGPSSKEWGTTDYQRHESAEMKAAHPAHYQTLTAEQRPHHSETRTAPMVPGSTLLRIIGPAGAGRTRCLG